MTLPEHNNTPNCPDTQIQPAITTLLCPTHSTDKGMLVIVLLEIINTNGWAGEGEKIKTLVPLNAQGGLYIFLPD